jgi:hypothetical protein
MAGSVVVSGLVLSIATPDLFGNSDAVDLANVVLPVVCMVSCGVVAAWRIARDGVMVFDPLTWCLVICVFNFGLGPLVYVFGDADTLAVCDALYVVRGADLLRTNLLNAFGILFVITGTMIVRLAPERWLIVHPQPMSLSDMRSLFVGLCTVGLATKYLLVVPYMLGVFGFAVPGFLLFFSKLTLVAICLGAFLWGSGAKTMLVPTIALLGLEMGYGLLTFGKADFLLGPIMFFIGMFLTKKEYWIVLLGLVVNVMLVFWITPLSHRGRERMALTSSDAREQRGARVSLQERVDFLVDYFQGSLDLPEQEGAAIKNTWTRYSFANVQSFAMNEHDSGRSNNILTNALIVFIPRILWPDKPNVSAVGEEFNYLVSRQRGSSLAVTVFGEAYWSGGWVSVALISSFVGVVFAVLGVWTYQFIRAGDLLWLPIAFAGIQMGTSIESWFVTTYLGALPTLAITWFLLRLVRFSFSTRAQSIANA